jgi:4a-hydroxytetrahydrobiopterin dehydratase
MNDLAQMHCSQIKKDTPAMDDREIDQWVTRVPGWQVFKKNGEPRLEKVFKFRNFQQAMSFTYQVAQTAEEEDHHPALLTEWGKVTVTWWTHRIKGLHLNDFIMAAKTSEIYGDQNGRDQ